MASPRTNRNDLPIFNFGPPSALSRSDSSTTSGRDFTSAIAARPYECRDSLIELFKSRRETGTFLFTCQSSAGLVMLSNLLHSCSRVQQLLVRVIFLRGISDSASPIRHLTSFRGYSAGVTVALNQADNNRLICFIAMHWPLIFVEQATAGPTTKPAYQGPD